MINLVKATSDKLTLITSSAATIKAVAAYVDCQTGGGSAAPSVRDPGNNGGIAIASAVATPGTDIVASPATNMIRNVKWLNVFNNDASLTCTVTVCASLNGTVFPLWTQFLRAGECLQYIEGIGWFVLADANAAAELFKIISADDAGGQAVNTVQPWFPTASGVTVPAGTTYTMFGQLWITSGATSHSTGLSFGGTATLTSIDYTYKSQRAAAITLGTAFSGIGQFNAATNNTVDTAGTAVGHYIEVMGTVRFNAAGNFIPQFTFSANPTGTITIKRNSKFSLRAVGDGSVVNAGAWA